MVEFENPQPDPDPDYPSSIWFIVFGISLGGLAVGADLGVFESQSFAIDEVSAYLPLLLSVGTLVGAILAAYAVDKFSRRWTIAMSAAATIIGVAFIVVDVSPATLLVGRALCGVGAGIQIVGVPLYVSEVAPKHQRGMMVTVFQVIVNIGGFGAAAILYELKSAQLAPYQVWRIYLAVQVAGALALVLSVPTVKYSPYYLILKQRHPLAVETIADLRGYRRGSQWVDVEYIKIDSWSNNSSLSRASLSNSKIVRRLLLVGLLQVIVNTVGSPASIIVMNVLTPRLGWPQNITMYASLGTSLVGTMLAFTLVDLIGRRILLMVGGALMTAGYVVTLIALKLGESDATTFTAVAGIGLVFLAWSASWGSLVWVVQSEIFPLRLRAKAMGIGAAVAVIWNAVATYVYPIISKPSVLGSYTFALLAAVSIMGIAAVFFLLPDTRGHLTNIDLDPTPDALNEFDIDVDIKHDRKAVNKK